MATISYYDAGKEAYVSFEGEQVHSTAGYTSGPEYRVLYRRADGMYVSGVRHQDRGDLMTDVKVTKTIPKFWR